MTRSLVNDGLVLDHPPAQGLAALLAAAAAAGGAPATPRAR